MDGIDIEDNGVIKPDGILYDVPREPDAVAWIRFGKGGKNSNEKKGGYFFATANEGDLFGGSRGFTIFNRNGHVLYDSGTTQENIAIRHGHYPEGRSDNKGSEPEAISFGTFWREDYLFVGSERGSFIAVYELKGARPKFKQLLPGPLGPEGLLPVPSRNLLIASGEEDDPTYGVRSSIMIYELACGKPDYPQILSENYKGAPIPWSALSGMAAVPDHPDKLLAVWDSFYSESKIFTIEPSRKPARIIDAITIEGVSGEYDPEGIAIAPDNTYWIASEGNDNKENPRPNLLLQIDIQGNVIDKVGLPKEIIECRASSTKRATLGSGFEGIAAAPRDDDGSYVLLVAQQRGWDYTTANCEHLDDDQWGLNENGQPLYSRIWIYDPKHESWDHVAWELAPLPENASWVGLSEITRIPNSNDYVVIERDNRTGDFAKIKTLVKFNLSAMDYGVINRSEMEVFDLLPALRKTNGWVTDKPEGVAVTEKGKTYVVTDNDGVDDWSGETWFLSLGEVDKLF